jgi:hypothetical protein
MAGGALLIGVLRWSLSQEESSIDSFYERLRASNDFLVNSKKAYSFVKRLMSTAEQEEFRRNMWVYTELDNLEYCFEKYAYRFMTADTAHRALGVFNTRWQNEEFRNLAIELVERGRYNEDFIAMVQELPTNQDCQNRDSQQSTQTPVTAKPISATNNKARET